MIFTATAAACFAAAVVLSPRLPGAVAPVIVRRVLDGAAIVCVAIAIFAAR